MGRGAGRSRAQAGSHIRGNRRGPRGPGGFASCARSPRPRDAAPGPLRGGPGPAVQRAPCAPGPGAGPGSSHRSPPAAQATGSHPATVSRARAVLEPRPGPRAAPLPSCRLQPAPGGHPVTVRWRCLPGGRSVKPTPGSHAAAWPGSRWPVCIQERGKHRPSKTAPVPEQPAATPGEPLPQGAASGPERQGSRRRRPGVLLSHQKGGRA